MRIKKTCLFFTDTWNVLPAILITRRQDGWTVALKWLTGHVGAYIRTKQVQGEYIGMVVHPTLTRGGYTLKIIRDEIPLYEQRLSVPVIWTVYGIKREGLLRLEYALTDCRDEETAELAAQALRNFHGLEDLNDD